MGRGLEDPAAIPSFSLSLSLTFLYKILNCYHVMHWSNKNICVIQANKYLQLVCIYVPWISWICVCDVVYKFISFFKSIILIKVLFRILSFFSFLEFCTAKKYTLDHMFHVSCTWHIKGLWHARVKFPGEASARTGRFNLLPIDRLGARHSFLDINLPL